MKILLIKISPVEEISSSMFRTIAIVHGLLEQGHTIDMIVRNMGSQNVKGKELDFVREINIIRLSQSKLQEQIRSRLGSASRIAKVKRLILKLLRKIWHGFRLYDGTISEAKKIDIHSLPTDDYDIVISSSDPKTSHIAVQRLIAQGLKYKKWIQYWGDPMTVDITNENVYPKFAVKRIEKKILKNADKIVYVSPFTLNQQKKMFPSYASKMFFLPVPYKEKIIYPKTNNEKFTVDYYGDYESRIRNLQPFYEACKSFEDTISVHIIGDSDLGLQSTANITVQPRGIIEKLQEKTDVIVCLLNHRGTQIPGKIYHAAGTNKKILVILDGEKSGEMRKYLETFHRFYLCDNHVDSIKHAILELMEDQKEYLPVEVFSFQNISRQLIE